MHATHPIGDPPPLRVESRFRQSLEHGDVDAKRPIPSAIPMGEWRASEFFRNSDLAPPARPFRRTRTLVKIHEFREVADTKRRSCEHSFRDWIRVVVRKRDLETVLDGQEEFNHVKAVGADILDEVSWFNQKWKIALYELDTGNRDVRSG